MRIQYQLSGTVITGSAKDVRDVKGFSKVSEEHGVVAVYPQGTLDSKGKSLFYVGYEFHGDSRSMTSGLPVASRSA